MKKDSTRPGYCVGDKVPRMCLLSRGLTSFRELNTRAPGAEYQFLTYSTTDIYHYSFFFIKT